MSPAPTPERPDGNPAGTRPQWDVSQRRRKPSTSARIEQPLFGLLLVAAGLFLAAAAVGLPLPFLPEKTNGDDNAKHLQAFVSSLGDWVRYPGWRYSAGAWFYAAVAAGTISAAFTWGRATTWSRPRRFLTVGAPQSSSSAPGRSSRTSSESRGATTTQALTRSATRSGKRR